MPLFQINILLFFNLIYTYIFLECAIYTNEE